MRLSEDARTWINTPLQEEFPAKDGAFILASLANDIIDASRKIQIAADQWAEKVAELRSQTPTKDPFSEFNDSVATALAVSVTPEDWKQAVEAAIRLSLDHTLPPF